MKESTDWKGEYMKLMQTLPIDKFIKDGETGVDWETLDAADFKDNANAFINAMEMARSVEIREGL